MKRFLGIAAGIAGGLLLIAGILWTGFYIMYASIPDNEDVPGIDDAIGMGLLAACLGAFVCWSSRQLLRSSESTDQGNPTPSAGRRPEEHLCPNCGCQPTEGSKTCEWCGADLK